MFVESLGKKTHLISGMFNELVFETDGVEIIHIDHTPIARMPDAMRQLIQGQTFSYRGACMETHIYKGGIPCIFTLDYDIRRVTKVPNFPDENWLKENVVFINIGQTPLWLKDEEKDRVYSIEEDIWKNYEKFGQKSSVPSKLKKIIDTQREQRKEAAKSI